jgi:hypothetical protein
MQEQQRVLLGAQSNLSFQIDLVSQRQEFRSGAVVLDTKYKRSLSPAPKMWLKYRLRAGEGLPPSRAHFSAARRNA